MNEDYLDPKYAEGMPKLADAAIAMEFLISVKTTARNYAVALTETTSADLRHVLSKQMEEALNLHEELSQLMMKKGWLYPNDLGKQIELDLKSMEVALGIAEMNLYPNDTDRLGMFATPDK
ncbi:spore coat protein [Ectobacillus ponti]|uniref:Spore coat protein n=1 Tax=Ectobacillus ponti TaxID=2961894 RepID=A0AA42BQD4_9BACI|nr:spore coat protein [Ectobacillus ponti]MCP8969281.1 spore coat protein [Ectobacillus ponti]